MLAGSFIEVFANPIHRSEYSHDYELDSLHSDRTSTRRLVGTRSHTSGRDDGGSYSALSPSPDELERGTRRGFSLSKVARWRPNVYKRKSRRSVASTTTLISGDQKSKFDGEFAVIDGGWWHRQMLVDRTLRTMAGTTTLFALVMLIICFGYIRPFIERVNLNSTSVGGKEGIDCATVERQDVVSLQSEQIWCLDADSPRPCTCSST